MPGKKLKVSPSGRTIFMIIAIFVDLLETAVDLIPLPPINWILNMLIDACTLIFFSVFLSGLYNISLWSSRNAGKTIITTLIDLVGLPLSGTSWVVYIASIVCFTYEEKEQEASTPHAPMLRL